MSTNFSRDQRSYKSSLVILASAEKRLQWSFLKVDLFSLMFGEIEAKFSKNCSSGKNFPSRKSHLRLQGYFYGFQICSLSVSFTKSS
jgi:hypothetical protein